MIQWNMDMIPPYSISVTYGGGEDISIRSYPRAYWPNEKEEFSLFQEGWHLAAWNSYIKLYYKVVDDA